MTRAFLSRLSLAVALLLVLTGVPAKAQLQLSSDAGDREALTVIFYDSGMGQVEEWRLVSLPGGDSGLLLEDVARNLRPETVRLAIEGAALLARSFRFDPLSQRRLLEEALGGRVLYRRVNPADGSESFEPVELLSLAEGPVIRRANRIEAVLAADISFNRLPEGLTARPVLAAEFRAAEGGQRRLSLGYLAGGFSWQADYALTLDAEATKGALEGAVTLHNGSDLDLAQARVYLVAGEVAQAGPPPGQPVMRAVAMEMSAMAPAPMPTARSFSDRHLYSLPEPVDLAAAGSRQVPLFAVARDLPVTRRYRLEGLVQAGRGAEETGPLSPEILIELANEAKSGLGRALPGGSYRVYQPTDSKGPAIFVGESRLGHTAEGETLEIALGRAFDITGRGWLLDYKRISNTTGAYELAQRVEIANAKEEAVTVELLARLPRGWQMLEETSQHEQLSASRLQWPLQIPAGGTTRLEFRIRVTP